MKIQFNRHLELVDLARTVMPGEVLESPADASEEQLRGYLQNGIAEEVPEIEPKKSASKIIDGGE